MEGWRDGRTPRSPRPLGVKNITWEEARAKPRSRNSGGSTRLDGGAARTMGLHPPPHTPLTAPPSLHHLHLHHLHLHLLLLKHECYEIVLDAAPLAALVLHVESFCRDQLLLKRRKRPFSVKIGTFINLFLREEGGPSFPPSDLGRREHAGLNAAKKKRNVHSAAPLAALVLRVKRFSRAKLLLQIKK